MSLDCCVAGEIQNLCFVCTVSDVKNSNSIWLCDITISLLMLLSCMPPCFIMYSQVIKVHTLHPKEQGKTICNPKMCRFYLELLHQNNCMPDLDSQGMLVIWPHNPFIVDRSRGRQLQVNFYLLHSWRY